MIAGQTVLGAYFPGTDENTYPIGAMPAGLLTHVFYAFATVENGNLTLPRQAPAHLAALAALKRANPGLRTVLSIGGWGAGAPARTVAGARWRTVRQVRDRAW